MSLPSSDLININKLNIITKTWSRDSHGLYDYEATTTTQNSFQINGKARIIRKKNQCKIISDSNELDIEERDLFTIRQDGSKPLFNLR